MLSICARKSLQWATSAGLKKNFLTAHTQLRSNKNHAIQGVDMNLNMNRALLKRKLFSQVKSKQIPNQDGQKPPRPWILALCKGIRVSDVGNKIVDASKAYLVKKANGAIERVIKAKENQKDVTRDDLVEDAEYSKWAISAGQEVDGSWKFHVVPSNRVKAFVSPLFPRHVFLSTGLLSVADTDDELAFIIAHEIAHLLHQDVSNRNFKERNWRFAELVFLCMIPTRGIATLCWVAGMEAVVHLAQLRTSRQDETNADMLAVELVTLAGFDRSGAKKALWKLEQL